MLKIKRVCNIIMLPSDLFYNETLRDVIELLIQVLLFIYEEMSSQPGLPSFLTVENVFIE